MFGAFDGVPGIAEANGRCADDESAVCHGFGETLELFGTGKKRRGADGRARFTKSQFVRIHDAKMEKAEIAHGAGGGADIERIARIDEDDAQAIELGLGRQGKTLFSVVAGRKASTTP